MGDAQGLRGSDGGRVSLVADEAERYAAGQWGGVVCYAAQKAEVEECLLLPLLHDLRVRSKALHPHLQPKLVEPPVRARPEREGGAGRRSITHDARNHEPAVCHRVVRRSGVEVGPHLAGRSPTGIKRTAAMLFTQWQPAQLRRRRLLDRRLWRFLRACRTRCSRMRLIALRSCSILVVLVRLLQRRHRRFS